MRTRQLFTSSVGTKLLIALTGLALSGFLVFHLAGNLLLFFGPEQYNEHAHSLISNPLVVPAELGLIAIFLLHVFKAISNYLGNRKARPVGYEAKAWAKGPSRKSWASTTMIVSGLITLAFVPLHLLTFKYGPHYASPEAGVRDLYRLLIEVFQRPGYVVFYVFAMTVTAMHLRHGVSSSLQSLGLIPARWIRAFLAAGLLLALAVGTGFVLIPVYIYLFVTPGGPRLP
ncbi:MAG TPA: succinate dehydrogenase cytochrome b subunit [Vicinamibacterales bacterium]|nr:succinate dehydrogenase cytochrome b subunit [Vicinamibacterales bacterium]